MLSSAENDTDYIPDNSLLDYIPEETSTTINKLSAVFQQGEYMSIGGGGGVITETIS